MDPNLQAQYPQYQQYQQQPAQGSPVSKSWHITKIVFTSLSMVFCIIAIGISIALAVNPDALSFAFIWTVPQAGVALIWSIAELITICVRARAGGHRGIHPGAHVALHLLLWLGFVIGLGLSAYLLAVAEIYSSDYYSYYDDYYNSYYSDDSYYEAYSGYMNLLKGLVAFLTLLAIIHFFLFVRACVETARRNRASTPVIMVPQPVYYQTPMQQQQQPTYAGQQNIQPGFPTQPQQAHLSEYYGQPSEVQQHMTGSSAGHLSQPTPVHEDGLHPVSPQH